MIETASVSDAAIGDPTAINRCLSGEILVIRGFLRDTGTQRFIRQAMMSSIEAVNPNVVRRAESAGLAGLHELLTAEELMDLVETADRKFLRAAPWLYKRILRRGLGNPGPVWVMRRSIVRVHAPFDRMSRYRQSLQRFRAGYGEGRLTTIRPHRDGWFAEPSTSVNIWIALGDVVPGNGISFFPQDYRTALNYEPKQGVTRDQALSRPVNVPLSEGDAVLFHADQLHASEINHCDLTRAALSLRLAMEDPRLSSPKPKRYSRVDSRRWASFFVLHPNKTVRQWSERLLRALPIVAAPPARGYTIRRPDDVGHSRPPGFRRCMRDAVSVAELETGRPLAISERDFLVKLDRDGQQQVWKMARRCPHEGADLALGHVEGRHIRCPWHNLPIDIMTGRSACQSLGAVGTRRCAIRDGWVDPGQ